MRCPECGNQNIQEYNGELSCRDCGLVVDEAGIEQPFITESIQKHATMPYLVVAGSKEQDGRIFKSSWMLSTREKNFRNNTHIIDLVASKLNLPELVLKESKLLFKKAQYSNIAIGRDNIRLAYASIYIACAMQGIPKTLLELTIDSEVNQKNVMKAVKLIRRVLEIRTPMVDPMDLLPRFASKLDLTPETITLTTEILIKIKGTGITTGKRPETILGGAIYVACKKTDTRRTQRQIANAIGIMELTIRKTSKKIICLE
jgi:transcription initiation factor TFIIB